MNYDRLLTRVWDKQEKKMTYVGDIFPSECLSDFISAYYNSFRFVGIEETGLTIIAHGKEAPHRMQIFSIPFGDRFVPMMCLGNTDKNKKLIYSADIVATSNNKYLVYREEESAAFWFKRLDNECELLIDDFSCEIEIIGNKWENPELLEVKV